MTHDRMMLEVIKRFRPFCSPILTPLLKRLQAEREQYILAGVLIAMTACYLYLPYLENPLVFDDANIFYKTVLTTATITPWELGTRGFPLFTLGWVQTQIGSMAAHRIVSLALHILVAYQLFRFLEAALKASANPSLRPDPSTATQKRWIAVLTALIFVCHPVAVYGAAYLVQRNIVLATLFALLCLRALIRALEDDNPSSATWAAIWASLAIMSKEHAVLVPVAALALILIVPRPMRAMLRIGGIFLTLSLPVMVFAAYTSFYAVGNAYEPGIKDIESEIFSLPTFADQHDKWLLSASSQARLYWCYWRQWLLPDSSHMSVDLRVNFLTPWTHVSAWLWIVGLTALPLLATPLLLRLKNGGLVAFAIIFTTFLFTTEVITIRFQEPYVLYRSYLWSIGYFTFIAAVVHLLPKKFAFILLLLVIPALLVQATSRLETFHSGMALWEDAAAKLPKPEIAGSSRIFFNRGRERYGVGNAEGALDDINTAIRLNPSNGRYRIARAVSMLGQGRVKEALDDLETAKKSMPEDGSLLFVQFRALQSLGRIEEADASLMAAARNGSYSAKFEIARRLSSGSKVTVEMTERP